MNDRIQAIVIRYHLEDIKVIVIVKGVARGLCIQGVALIIIPIITIIESIIIMFVEVRIITTTTIISITPYTEEIRDNGNGNAKGIEQQP